MFNRKDFYLSSIIEDEDDRHTIIHNLSLRKVNIIGDYSSQMPVDWYKYYNKFLVRKTPIPFKPGDDGEDEDLIVIEDFELPTYFRNFRIPSDIRNCPMIENHHINPRVIKSFIASINYKGETLILFQKFKDYTQLQQSSAFTYDVDSGNLKELDKPVLSFGSSIMAVYKYIEKNGKIEKKLIFKRFNDVSYILDLKRYFAPLCAEGIEDFLDEGPFIYNKKKLNDIIHKASPLLATRFALVKKSGILDRVTAQKIKAVSDKYKNIEEKYNVTVDLSDDGENIIFPHKKSDAHNLLGLLSKKYFTDDFDDMPHLARGSRPLSK